MSDTLVHALAGDWIGDTLSKVPDKRINNGFVAALLAFASHALFDRNDQDYTPDWVAWRSDADRFRQDLPYVAAQASGLAITLMSVFQEKDKGRFQMRLAGLLSALAPDIIDGVYAYLHPEAWQKGNLCLPWHRSDEPKQTSMTREEALHRTAYLALLQLRF